MHSADGARVRSLLDYPGLIEALREAHTHLEPQSTRIVLEDPSGGANRFATLFGWESQDLIAVKLVAIFPGNPSLTPPLPSTPGLVAVFSGKTGIPLLVADGAEMTFRKTAADSALGASFLANDDVKTLLIVGAGNLARHMIEAHRVVRPSLKKVLIWNRTHEKAAALARITSETGTPAFAVQDLDGAVAKSDIICCVTMSTIPLVKGEFLKPGAHLDLVGAYLPDMREADDDAMIACNKYADNLSGAASAGDFAQLIDNGKMTMGDVKGDLFGLCSGKLAGRVSRDERTLFKNNGGGHLDLYTARYLAARIGETLSPAGN